MGGVLSQLSSDQTLHPVAYFSTALQGSQLNWSTTEKEAYALVAAVRHWHVYLAGNHFTLHSDHNPLTRLRESKNPHRKISRWLSELEEYNYTIQYIRGALNNKADALSRQPGASQIQPPSTFEDRIYALFTDSIHFKSQLLDAQSTDLLISDAIKHINQKVPISTGRLKRVQSQLRLQDGVLTKSGRPVLPASLRSVEVQEYHNIAHLGVDKTYDTIRDRFYWSNMFNYIKSFISRCETCQRTKCDTRPPKAPLTDMFVPNAPMQFISIDIGYLPKDNHGYQYILLIGDIFSKFVQIVPLKDQSAPVIIDALLSSWVFVHGKPLYLLSDQGSNVDGQVMHNICNELGIEKRRSSAYHSQGNGFAERHIRIVKDMLRAVILHRHLPQTSWRQLLPSLIFALNTSLSKANNCIPYNVVFGCSALLPQDVAFGHAMPDPCDHQSVIDYEHTVSASLNDVFHFVCDSLKVKPIVYAKTLQSKYTLY